jgi:FMN phosphatase YigB (HAD superfamily)
VLEIGSAGADYFIEEFLSVRLQAERRCLSQREEATLDQIWRLLHELMPRMPRSFGPQDELNAERSLLLPNCVVAEQIAQLRSAGRRIVFTSDSYLPEEFVREQLLQHGLAQEGDGIYVSSATGVTKRLGGIFKLILEREGILSRDLHHYGDDPHSDVNMPRRLGIETTLLSSSRPNLWERAILSEDVRYHIATSLLAGSMRAFRLSKNYETNSSLHALVATFLGPVLMVWAAWLLGAAQRDAVRRLYFVSRDGYLVYRAARLLAPHFGDIECRYLKISRQSILLPSTDEISRSGMPWLQRSWEPPRLERLVKKLGLEWSQVADQFSIVAGNEGQAAELTSDRDWDEFWRIVEGASVAPLVRKYVQTQRTNVLAYLKSEGLFDPIPMAMVDIGWNLTVQSSLQKLLGSIDRAFAFSGYYMALSWMRVPPVFAGRATALFYEAPPDHKFGSPNYEVFRRGRQSVLEHVLGLAPHGTIREHKLVNSVVEPVCPPESTFHTDLVGRMAEAVELFCSSNMDHISGYADIFVARQLIDSLVKAWCSQPNKKALEALDHVIASDDPNNLDPRPLVQPWYVTDAAKMLMPTRWRRKLGVKTRDPVWPEAALCRSSLFPTSVLRFRAALRGLLRSSRI